MRDLLLIFIGAGLGGVLRFVFGKGISQILGSAFPFGTLGVNVVGGLFMGIAAAFLARANGNSSFIQYFVMIGLLGGFTTFSSFSLECVRLFESGNFLGAGAYIAASVILSIFAVLLGLYVARSIV